MQFGQVLLLVVRARSQKKGVMIPFFYSSPSVLLHLLPPRCRGLRSCHVGGHIQKPPKLSGETPLGVCKAAPESPDTAPEGPDTAPESTDFTPVAPKHVLKTHPTGKKRSSDSQIFFCVTASPEKQTDIRIQSE